MPFLTTVISLDGRIFILIMPLSLVVFVPMTPIEFNKVVPEPYRYSHTFPAVVSVNGWTYAAFDAMKSAAARTI